MSKINLVYWNGANFGDALSPALIEELSGHKVRFKLPKPSLRSNMKMLLNIIKDSKYSELSHIELPWQKSLLAVGSIMDRANKKSIIWGSGFMNNDEAFHGGDVYAVRGKYTDEKLQKSGFAGCKIYGDPALLLPLWISPSNEREYKLGIIPHWREVDYFQASYGDRYKVIDLRTKEIYKIVEEITKCEYVLSTSLHGVIVAHAYNIPALWIKKGYIDTDGFKFYDYFSSVDISCYDGFDNIDHLLQNTSNYLALFKRNRDRILINNSLEQIQQNLLKSVPFVLIDKYRRLIE